MLNPFSDMAGFTMNPLSALPTPDLANPLAPPKNMPGMDMLNGGSPGGGELPGWDQFMSTVKKPMEGASSAVEQVAPVGGGSKPAEKLGIK